MAKQREGWQKGEGVYSDSSKMKFLRPDPHDDGTSIDRSKIVDLNNDANGGFPAPLVVPKD